MTDIKETVARVMCASCGINPDLAIKGPLWKGFQLEAEEAIEALKEAGYVIVPVEPTKAMLKAGIDAAYNCPGHEVLLNICLAAHKAMIAAHEGEE